MQRVLQEALIAGSGTIKAYYDGYMGNATCCEKHAKKAKEPASRSCQVPPTEGLSFIRGGPSQVRFGQTIGHPKAARALCTKAPLFGMLSCRT